MRRRRKPLHALAASSFQDNVNVGFSLSINTGPVNKHCFRVQGVGGRTHTNWAYDDGSAETRVVTPSNDLLTSDEWAAIASDANRYMLFPK